MAWGKQKYNSFPFFLFANRPPLIILLVFAAGELAVLQHGRRLQNYDQWLWTVEDRRSRQCHVHSLRYSWICGWGIYFSGQPVSPHLPPSLSCELSTCCFSWYPLVVRGSLIHYWVNCKCFRRALYDLTWPTRSHGIAERSRLLQFTHTAALCRIFFWLFLIVCVLQLLRCSLRSRTAKQWTAGP